MSGNGWMQASHQGFGSHNSTPRTITPRGQDFSPRSQSGRSYDSPDLGNTPRSARSAGGDDRFYTPRAHSNSNSNSDGEWGTPRQWNGTPRSDNADYVTPREKYSSPRERDSLYDYYQPSLGTLQRASDIGSTSAYQMSDHKGTDARDFDPDYKSGGAGYYADEKYGGTNVGHGLMQGSSQRYDSKGLYSGDMNNLRSAQGLYEQHQAQQEHQYHQQSQSRQRLQESQHNQYYYQQQQQQQQYQQHQQQQYDEDTLAKSMGNLTVSSPAPRASTSQAPHSPSRPPIYASSTRNAQSWDYQQKQDSNHQFEQSNSLSSYAGSKPYRYQGHDIEPSISTSTVVTDHTSNSAPDDFDIESLFSSARHGRVDEIEKVLNAGVPIDVRDGHGNTILIIACQNGNKRVAKLVLRRGANINGRNHKGNSPLHYCFHYGYGDSLGQYLISKGADASIRNNAGRLCWDGI